MFVFSLVIYQFYSSSIVSGLLRPTVNRIDSIKKLDDSGIDVGVENWNVLTRVIEVYKHFYLKIAFIIFLIVINNNIFFLCA